jgi:hypothetical protein
MSNITGGGDPLADLSRSPLGNIPSIGSSRPTKYTLDSVPTLEGQNGILGLEQAYAARDRQAVRLVAQVFGKPKNSAMQKVLNEEEYLHLRSGKKMNFYFPGYSDGIPPSEKTFNLAAYIKAQAEMETLTKWKGGLETDLLLLNSVHDLAANHSRLNYSGVVAITLERALAAKAIPSVAGLLGEILRFTEAYVGDDPTWGFSDQQGLKCAGSALKQLLLSLLPKWLKGDAEKAKHFVVTDVSR